MTSPVPEPTERLSTRVPVRLVTEAHRKASQTWPDITASGLVRVALARLAGLPEDPSDLPRRNRLTGKIH